MSANGDMDVSGPNACYFSKFLGGAHQIDIHMFIVMRKWIIVLQDFYGDDMWGNKEWWLLLHWWRLTEHHFTCILW